MRTYVLIALSFALAFTCAAQQTNDHQAPAEAAPGMQQMQGRMQDMQVLMDRIRKTEDPQERERLMSEHMQSMQQAMTMMAGMMRGHGDVSAQPRECAQGNTAEAPAAKPDDSDSHEARH